MTTTLARRPLVRWYYKCRSCGHRWADTIMDARFCPRCRGPAKLFGMKVPNK